MPKSKAQAKTYTLSCYADQIPNPIIKRYLFDLQDQSNIGWFTVPANWFEQAVANAGYDSVQAFLDDYTCDTTDGWISQAVQDGALLGFGWGVIADDNG